MGGQACLGPSAGGRAEAGLPGAESSFERPHAGAVETAVAGCAQARQDLDGPRAQSRARPLAPESGKLRSQAVDLCLEREGVMTEPQRLQGDADARQSAQTIRNGG